MNFQVDKAKAVKKWSPILEALYVKDEVKRDWMSEYAELHSMNENVSYATLGNVQGMGAIYSPQPSATPGSIWGADATPGSGDVGQNLLPVSMKIAAQTIGLDLVAVKPAASPKVDLLFVDFRYDDNNDEDSDRPLVFKLSATNGAALKTALLNHLTAKGVTEMVGGLDKRTFVSLSGFTALNAFNVASSSKEQMMEFLGFSRIDGLPMFRIFRQTVEVGSYINAFDQTKNTFTTTGSIVDALDAASLYTGSGALTGTTALTGATIELVSIMEDHIPGFSAGWNLFKGMTRDQDEKTYPGQIGPNVFTKTIQVGDIEITSALKRTEIEDIKASTGMDIVQKLESVLINELSQTISKEIVQKVKELCELNRASHTTPKTSTGDYKFDFNVDGYVTGWNGAGGETSHSLQRKLISKINNASNYIANEGRVGPAQYIVTNGNLASVMQDVASYTINPVQGSNLNTNGQLYPVGKIGNMTLYVDPYMRWDDNRVFLGRKNSVDQPGLLFLPYLMAQSISLISEATWAPRMLIRSRYAVADIGFFPEKQFMAIHVTDNAGYLI